MRISDWSSDVCSSDLSGDGTLAALRGLKAEVPELRVLRHAAQSGQSTAIRSGVKAARGAWIATLDGDGQNDPADIAKLLARRAQSPTDVKRSEEHTSELQSLMRISYAVFCLKKKNKRTHTHEPNMNLRDKS